MVKRSSSLVVLNIVIDCAKPNMLLFSSVVLSLCLGGAVVIKVVRYVVVMTGTVDAVVVDVVVKIVVAHTACAVVVDMDLDRVVAPTGMAVVVNMVLNGVVALTIDPVVADLDPYSVATP
jgi:hypothetical protein